MSGFFGIIHADRSQWQGWHLQPRPQEAAQTIWRLREIIRTAPPMPGNGPVQLDTEDIPFEDTGVLTTLTAFVFMPQTPQLQMISATAIALLINSPFFYIEGIDVPNGCDCQLFRLYASTAEEANAQFMASCGKRFLVTA